MAEEKVTKAAEATAPAAKTKKKNAKAPVFGVVKIYAVCCANYQQHRGRKSRVYGYARSGRKSMRSWSRT